MHAVVRSYSGPGVKELFDLLEERQQEMDTVLGSVTGLVSYSAIRTEHGAITVTVCENKAGTDESSEVARAWIRDKAPELGTQPPAITEGPVILHLSQH